MGARRSLRILGYIAKMKFKPFKSKAKGKGLFESYKPKPKPAKKSKVYNLLG